MKIIELVNYFRNKGSFEEFCHSKSLNLSSEVIEIYMEKPFTLENDLKFFEIEDTEGRREYIVNNVKYYNLFDFFYFLEAIEESTSGDYKSLSNNEIANMLLSYAINNA